MGKIVIAFLFFITASTLAIREARPVRGPTPPSGTRVEAPRAHEPPSRAVHETVPPWVRLAAPPPQQPAAVTPPPLIVQVPPAVVTIDDGNDNDSAGDVIDVIDRCPDQPEDDRDDDGCPGPILRPVRRPIIMVETIY